MWCKMMLDKKRKQKPKGRLALEGDQYMCSFKSIGEQYINTAPLQTLLKRRRMDSNTYLQ